MARTDVLARMAWAKPSAAIAWGITSALLFALANVTLRMVPRAGAFDIALIRSAVFAIVLLPFVPTPWKPCAVVGGARAGVGLALFTVTTIVTTLTWFLGMRMLPLATATSLFSLKAAFAVFGAAVLMAEPLSARRLVALCIGFIGGAVLLQPGRPSLLGAAWVLCAAATSSLSVIFYAQLVRAQPPARVLLFSSILQFMVLAPVALAGTAGLPLHTLLMAGINATLSIGVMQSLAWAYRGADVGLVALLEYLRLPFAAGLAYFFFNEQPTVAFYIGSTIIVASLLVARPMSRVVAIAPVPAAPDRSAF